MNKKEIKVSIFNNDYILEGNDPEQVRKYSGYLDDIMNKINFDVPNQSEATIAVVSALNITENYFNEKEKRKKLEEEHSNFFSNMKNKIDEISMLIENSL